MSAVMNDTLVPSGPRSSQFVLRPTPGCYSMYSEVAAACCLVVRLVPLGREGMWSREDSLREELPGRKPPLYWLTGLCTG